MKNLDIGMFALLVENRLKTDSIITIIMMEKIMMIQIYMIDRIFLSSVARVLSKERPLCIVLF